MWCSRAALAFVLAAFALLAACGGDGDGAQPTVPLDSGIYGRVTIGPMCPVVTQNSPCPDEPYQTTVAVLDESGDEVTTFETAEDGAFLLNLFPGRYTLVPEQPNQGAPPTAAERIVDVPQGTRVEVNISYDSGIR